MRRCRCCGFRKRLQARGVPGGVPARGRGPLPMHWRALRRPHARAFPPLMRPVGRRVTLVQQAPPPRSARTPTPTLRASLVAGRPGRRPARPPHPVRVTKCRRGFTTAVCTQRGTGPARLPTRANRGRGHALCCAESRPPLAIHLRRTAAAARHPSGARLTVVVSNPRMRPPQVRLTVVVPGG